jgi:hypothetical protein
MNAQWTLWILWGAMLAMGIAVAGGVGYFLFQGEILNAIFFGFLPTVAIGGSLWMTRNLLTEAPQ